MQTITTKYIGPTNTKGARVPPSITTAIEAVAWTFGLESNNYNPIVES